METIMNGINHIVGLVGSIFPFAIPASFFYPSIRVFRGRLPHRVRIRSGIVHLVLALIGVLIWCKATDFMYSSLMANKATSIYLAKVPYIHQAITLMQRLYLPVWVRLSTIIGKLLPIIIGR